MLEITLQMHGPSVVLGLVLFPVLVVVAGLIAVMIDRIRGKKK